MFKSNKDPNKSKPSITFVRSFNLFKRGTAVEHITIRTFQNVKQGVVTIVTTTT